MIHSSTSIEYRDLVMDGQTHSLPVHNRHYNFSDACKKRKLEKGVSINQTYQRITRNPVERQPHSVELSKSSQEPNQSDSTTSDQISVDCPERVQTQCFYPTLSPLSKSEISDAMNELDFGIARKDINITAKKYPWISEEINYLVFYIETIESDQTNRFANCLTHIRTEAPLEVKQYFHPHHVANSDRLKNGFNVALKKINKENI